MTTKVNEARDLVRKLKLAHRELGPRIREAETAVGNGADEEEKKSLQKAFDALRAENEALEAKRAAARKALNDSRCELRKELNRRISAATDLNELALIRITARRESLPEHRIRAKVRILERRISW